MSILRKKTKEFGNQNQVIKTMSVILEYISSVNPDHVMYAVLAGIMVFCVIAMYRLNADERSPIDVLDLITTDGKLDESKTIRFFTWVVSTWGFIYLIADHKLTEWYFIGYMGAWVANALIDNRSNVSKYRSHTTSYEDREEK